MKKEIKYSKSSVRYLRRLAKNVRKNIVAKIDILAVRPEELEQNITKLQNADDLYRLRVGNYRVIYTQTEILFIEEVGPRGGIYKK